METQVIQKGNILIARPALTNDVFSRSVVLLTDHSAQTGSVGFVLNKPLDLPLNELVKDLQADFVVYEGGPVDQDNIYYLHCRPDLIADSQMIRKGLYWSGNYADVKHAINNGYISENEIRFYLGYSGWAKEQLQGEVNRNAWTIVEDKQLDIFSDWENDLWKQQMQKLGGENLLWVNMPENPLLN